MEVVFSRLYLFDSPIVVSILRTSLGYRSIVYRPIHARLERGVKHSSTKNISSTAQIAETIKMLGPRLWKSF